MERIVYNCHRDEEPRRILKFKLFVLPKLNIASGEDLPKT